MSNSHILKSGNTPPQIGVPGYLNYEEMLLYAAWLYGINQEDKIHRKALFVIVQCYIANKFEDSLQQTLETSANWIKRDSGIYSLSRSGYKKMLSRFGPQYEKAPLPNFFILNRVFAGRTYMIEINTRTGKLQPKVDNIEIDGIQVISQLKSLGAKFKIGENSSSTTRFWAWIIQGDNHNKSHKGNYSWTSQSIERAIHYHNDFPNG